MLNFVILKWDFQFLPALGGSSPFEVILHDTHFRGNYRLKKGLEDHILPNPLIIGARDQT
jgi:hypothetical protein